MNQDSSIRMISSDRELEEVINELRGERLYAIDTEFQGERSFFPKLAMIQIAWSNGLCLIDPLEVDVHPLGEIIGGNATAVIHACSQDLPILERACGARPRRLFDPQIAGAFLGYGRASLGTLLREQLGIEVEKGSQLADWMRRPLPARELRYAASDVEYLLELSRALRRDLKEDGRLAWVEAECERELGRHRLRFQPERAWWRLKGKGKLRGKARGVAQAVCEWRERTARQKDRVLKHVLSDMAVMGIAQRPPTDSRQLRNIRGLAPNQLREDARDELLDAIADGLEMSPDELVLPPKRPGDGDAKAMMALSMAWLAQISSDEGVEQTLLGTRDDVVDLMNEVEGARLSEGWRFEVAGRSLRRIMTGECGLGCRPDGALMLWERPDSDPDA